MRANCALNSLNIFFSFFVNSSMKFEIRFRFQSLATQVANKSSVFFNMHLLMMIIQSGKSVESKIDKLKHLKQPRKPLLLTASHKIYNCRSNPLREYAKF